MLTDENAMYRALYTMCNQHCMIFNVEGAISSSNKPVKKISALIKSVSK